MGTGFCGGWISDQMFIFHWETGGGMKYGICNIFCYVFQMGKEVYHVRENEMERLYRDAR